MNKKKSFTLASITLSAGLLLAACNSSTTGGNTSVTGKDGKLDTSKFPIMVSSNKAPIKGGTLNYGLISDTPFQGTLSEEFESGAPDQEVLQFVEESIFSTNKNYEITNDGACTFTIGSDNKSITIKVKDGVKWSDGQPLTADDIIFPYEVMGSKDYNGVRYGDNTITQDIVGMAAYHAGKAKTISGLQKIDDKTVKISFNHVNPGLLTGIWSYAMPKHYFKGVPISKMATSDQVRKKPIGFGPFEVSKIVPGESVEFTANPNYYKGKPLLNKVILKVVNPQVVVKSLQNGDIDIAEFPSSSYKGNENPKNYKYIARLNYAYSYIGFKLGHWDAKNNVAVADPNSPMANKSLRQALGYALDMKTISQKFYQGLSFPANSIIPSFFSRYHDDNIKGYTFDPEKAKKLLDAAGYKDIDKDGYREDPKGHKLVLNFAGMSGSKVAEPLAQYYIQAWKAIGIHVQLLDGRLQEFNTFYDRVGDTGKDDPKINIYAGSWLTGTDPDPSGLYSKTSLFNFPRFVNNENEKLLQEGISAKAMDPNYRKQVYDQWQQLMFDQAPVIPTLYQYQVYGVNNRVTGYTADTASLWWYKVGVTSDKPATANN
ncbi:oligopeptide ABC transporter substrate-binding protein [Heyndrickxia acidicola]|uniref:Oligopeptide ABC transporter substrate-binding protein n=1 Tax=Heyndrickxia acidicola TaxID=209389 RepID=A0ABU6MCW8_9BACI|nr:oligopeptide ABC transporter substrate-binding protein [Heyndrickxia acidicola]MED1202512.1 oligopeptide ABC transporter substrate-binding protein [Heyndrickxia acidicola]